MKHYLKAKNKYVEIDLEQHGQYIYMKEEGKYYPTHERLDWLDYLREGDYLVKVRAKSRSLCQRQFPKHSAESEIAAKCSAEKLCKVISKVMNKGHYTMYEVEQAITKELMKWQD